MPLTPKAVFYVEINGKVKKKILDIPEKLFVLDTIIDKLMEYDIENEDNMEDCPFNVCYNHLASECTKIGTKFFKLDYNEYWAEFVKLDKRDMQHEEIGFAVNLIKLKLSL